MIWSGIYIYSMYISDWPVTMSKNQSPGHHRSPNPITERHPYHGAAAVCCITHQAVPPWTRWFVESTVDGPLEVESTISRWSSYDLKNRQQRSNTIKKYQEYCYQLIFHGDQQHSSLYRWRNRLPWIGWWNDGESLLMTSGARTCWSHWPFSALPEVTAPRRLV